MKSRLALFFTSMVVMVVVAAGVALAASINCGPSGGPCLGTNGSDTITGSNDADNITAAAGADTVHGNGGNDQIYGDGGGDTLNGDDGSDYVEAGRGDNVARGNAGDGDVVNVVDFDVNDFASGGDGSDDVCLIDDAGFSGFDDVSFSTCETIYATEPFL